MSPPVCKGRSGKLQIVRNRIADAITRGLVRIKVITTYKRHMYSNNVKRVYTEDRMSQRWSMGGSMAFPNFSYDVS